MDAVKKFSWSWSKLKNFRSCPKRHYEIDLTKNIKELPSDELKWGDLFHDAMAKRIGRGTPLPAALIWYDGWAGWMRGHKEAGANVSTELRLAMDAQFQPTEWFSPSTWVRGIVDVLYLAPWLRSAAALDWKTGKKIQPEFEQLGITAGLLFAHHREIDTVHTAYLWSAHDTDTIETYHREEMTPLWNKIMPDVKRMEEAARTLTYPPKPSGLCIKYCPVTSCPYHGKGDR
jgi:hypothetical protein